MSCNKFYSFRSKLVGNTVMAVPNLPKFSLNEEQASKRLVKGNYISLEFPIVFNYSEGKKFNDILDTGYVSLFLISDRLKNILEDNKFTGWRTYPIIFYDKKGNEIKGYHGFSVTGRSGPINYENSKITKKQDSKDSPIYECSKGYAIDENTWDGSDFFLPENTTGISVPESVVKVLKPNKITNLNLWPFEDIEIPVCFLK